MSPSWETRHNAARSSPMMPDAPFRNPRTSPLAVMHPKERLTVWNVKASVQRTPAMSPPSYLVSTAHVLPSRPHGVSKPMAHAESP